MGKADKMVWKVLGILRYWNVWSFLQELRRASERFPVCLLRLNSNSTDI